MLEVERDDLSCVGSFSLANYEFYEQYAIV